MPTRKKIGLVALAALAASSLGSARTKGSATSFSSTSRRRRTNFAKGKPSTSSRTARSSATTPDHRLEQVGRPRGLRRPHRHGRIPRKGQSRDDLVATNLPIIRDVTNNAKKHCPDAFVIVISNPLDAMVTTVQARVTGCDKSKIAGMAGVLDSARFQLFLARGQG